MPLSPNFETGVGVCSGNEVNLVRSLAAGGTPGSLSSVVYAGTDGFGPINTSPAGGHLWVTTNAAGELEPGRTAPV